MRRSSSRSQKFEEGVDYYIDESGNFVFTAEYLESRGTCCKNGCRHCPFGFNKKQNQ